MDSITCPQCGTVNPVGASFCRGCGLNLAQQLRQSGVLQQPIPGQAPTAPATPGASSSPTVVHGAGQPGAPPHGVVAQALTSQIGSQPLAPGVTLQGGRCVIDRALGAGGMGSVFLAHDTHVNNKPVAISLMATGYADLRIMSDDGFYNPGEFVALPGHKSRFVFTGFFYPDQARLVRDPAARRVIQTMEDRYRTNFHRADLPLGRYGSDRVPAGTALSYDAQRDRRPSGRGPPSAPTSGT